MATGNVSVQPVVDAVVAPASGNAFDVFEGSLVKAIHFELWVLNFGATGTTSQHIAIIEKVPSNQASVTFTQIANLGAYTNKKNILWSYQGNQGASVDGNTTIPIIRDWLLIPKGKQRMGLGDRIVFSIAAVGQTLQICGLMTYKEFR